MKKMILFLCLVLQHTLYGAAFSPRLDIPHLEAEIEKAIRAGSPVAGIIENLEKLAILHDAKGDALGQLEALRRISGLKGVTKEKREVNDVRVGNMFKDLEKRLKAQAGQSADMRQHYQAQIMLGRLYLLRNEVGDVERASSLFKLASAQKEYPELKGLAYLALGDLNIALNDPKATAFAIGYYGLVPEGDISWPLAQAKLGILLMHQGKEEDAKRALVNGADALNDRSISFEDRLRAKMTVANELRLDDWQRAAAFFVQIADEGLSGKDRLDANMEAAVLLQRTQPLLAPIYFKRVFEAPVIKEMDPDLQAYSRLIAAKELASLAAERDAQAAFKYLREVLTGVNNLIASLVKNKKLLNGQTGIIRHFLIGGYGVESVIRKAEERIGDNPDLQKIKAEFEKIDQYREELEIKKNIEL